MCASLPTSDCVGRNLGDLYRMRNAVAGANAALHSSHSGLVDWNASRERVLILKYLYTSLLIMGRKVPEGRTKLCKQL